MGEWWWPMTGAAHIVPGNTAGDHGNCVQVLIQHYNSSIIKIGLNRQGLCTLGQNKGSHGHRNILHYVTVTWMSNGVTVWFLLQSHHWYKQLQNLILHLFIIFERSSTERNILLWPMADTFCDSYMILEIHAMWTCWPNVQF